MKHAIGRIYTPPLIGRLIHLRVSPQFPSTHLYTWVERGTVRVSAGSHFDISISTNINISIIKIRKIFVIRGYISISISIRKWKKFHSLCLCLCLCNPGSHIFFLFFLRLCLCLCLCICQSVNRAALKCLAQEHNTMSPGRARTKY